mmetsp:Transcript_48017/g.88399  ORF Transcript_48017/g.88399 Transcript_48017/m.88399 type:complete len:314 (+) Transcript_48017:64-1005(+)
MEVSKAFLRRCWTRKVAARYAFLGAQRLKIALVSTTCAGSFSDVAAGVQDDTTEIQIHRAQQRAWHRHQLAALCQDVGFTMLALDTTGEQAETGAPPEDDDYDAVAPAIESEEVAMSGSPVPEQPAPSMMRTADLTDGTDSEHNFQSPMVGDYKRQSAMTSVAKLPAPLGVRDVTSCNTDKLAALGVGEVCEAWANDAPGHDGSIGELDDAHPLLAHIPTTPMRFGAECWFDVCVAISTTSGVKDTKVLKMVWEACKQQWESLSPDRVQNPHAPQILLEVGVEHAVKCARELAELRAQHGSDSMLASCGYGSV